jgi:uncharacterized protein YqgC (DUF456 family)
MTMTILAVVISSLFLLAAVGFTVVPILPGTLFLFPAILAYGFLEDFTPFTTWFWIGQILLTLIYLVSDNIAQLLGIKKMGGSKSGMIGGTIGMFVLPLLISPFGLLALFLGPLLGAVAGAMVGEMIARRQSDEIIRVGWGSALSFLAGTFFKFVLVMIQVVWFYIAIF